MTATLFLSETVTALLRADAAPLTAPSLFGRKGRLRPHPADLLGELGVTGDVVAGLPPAMTWCRKVKVRAAIGRQVSHHDLSVALEAALAKAGDAGSAVVSAEPTRMLLDGQACDGNVLGRPAQVLDVEYTAFLSSLTDLAALEKALAEAGMKLTGVMAMEELAAASLAGASEVAEPLAVVDRWHTKVIGFAGDAAAASALSPVGYGHIVSDLAVTFMLSDEDAEARARHHVLGRTSREEEEQAGVVLARIDELASELARAAGIAGISGDRFTVLGLPASPPVEAAFARHGLAIRVPGLELEKTQPPVLALCRGAGLLAAGAVPRSAVTALQLAAPRDEGGVLGWLRRNF